MRGIPLLALMCMLLTAPADAMVRLDRSRARRGMGDEAASPLTAPIALVFLIVGAMLTMIVVAALFGDYVDAVKDVNENLTTADFGDPTTTSIAPVFAIVVGISALAGLVGLIVYSVVKGRGGGLGG